MAEILVLANETIGGAKLLDTIRERHAEGDARFHVVVPQTRPKHGNVIYDEAVRDSAQVRVDLALAFMREEGIEGAGEVGDGDPLNAAHDAIAAHGITEIIVSTLPESTSGSSSRTRRSPGASSSTGSRCWPSRARGGSSSSCRRTPATAGP